MADKRVFDFQCEVIEQSHDMPVLVDFWAEWCAPCRMLGPVLEKLAEKHAGRWKLVKINTEEHPDLATQYGIRGIPNVKLFIKGAVREEFSGALPERQIEEWLKKAIPSPLDKEVDIAEGFVREGKSLMARSMLEGVLQKEPGHMRARALLVRISMFSRPEEALRLSEALEGEPEWAELAETARTLVPLLLADAASLPEDEVKPVFMAAIESLRRERFDEALQGFIRVLREHRMYHDDASRRACIAIFRYLGEGHEVSLRHRRAFDRAF